MVVSRGDIRFPELASQLRDYSGLRFGNITPTDIDGLIEYKNRGYIILELKYVDAKILPGQRLALERLTDDLAKSGKKCLCIIASHNTDNPHDKIDAANTIVVEYRYRGQWLNPQRKSLTKELVEHFVGIMEG